MGNALSTVKKFFPGVEEVVDATRPAKIEVTPQDAAAKGRKNHEGCAMAVACKRKFNLDGVIISRSTAYLVKGKKARRFHLPQSVAKEVVSCDRGGGFAPGIYMLNAVPKAHQLGQQQGSNRRTEGNGKPKRFRHLTSNIRDVLGSQDPDA